MTTQDLTLNPFDTFSPHRQRARAAGADALELTAHLEDREGNHYSLCAHGSETAIRRWVLAAADGAVITGRAAAATDFIALRKILGIEDARVDRAMADVFGRKGSDRHETSDPHVGRLELDHDRARLTFASADGSCELSWDLEESACSGVVILAGARREVSGQVRARRAAPSPLSLSARFPDGSQLELEGADRGHVAVRRPDGGTMTAEAVVTVRRRWRSARTFLDYPVQLSIEAPALELTLEVVAVDEDREMVALGDATVGWLGRVAVEGRLAGAAVAATAWLHAEGHASFSDLDGYFRAVGALVRKSVARVLPLELDASSAAELVAAEGREHYLDGLDLEQLSRALIAPIRDITDRGGKGWRSYAAIACCELVGGDARDFVDWIAMPELLHVGSLIVDDVEDRSELRRGGPAAHLMHGQAKAINAGTAAYFMNQRLLASSPHLSDADRLRLYDLYFEAMRAGHAGQAIDLDGLDRFLDEAVEAGDAAGLERRVLAIHRLKTAAPAACLARMGAIAGGGTTAQIEAVGDFFEAIGMAFQIMDDVLNLRGFSAGLKTRGEDVSHGKVTAVVAKAMGLLDVTSRRWLAEILRARPTDTPTIAAVVARLEACGALDACERQAAEMIEAAWSRLDPLAEPSLAKVMLRAFGWFVLERHY